ncbi:MAG TPA: di-heme oxidoredictase family protein [Thermoanaerobaculia bacterium]|jgi:CxxC motif-containing protein (DUF1111 family)|nr:di-heme oxidoredictase family protein [Thermoanaerobaculia bacterium]
MWQKKASTRRLIILAGFLLFLLAAPLVYGVVMEAPAGFDDMTNGFTSQTQFEADKEIFDDFELIGNGLGPVYNAQACRECHQNPVSGSSTQVTELRVGRTDAFGNFFDRPGGSLINDRAIHPDIQERVAGEDTVRATRSALTLLGLGFVEAISDTTLTSIQTGQSATVRGTIVNVPVLEAPGQTRIGRFGWKDQHASLVSFAADAYLNEMGITSPLQPTENTSNGSSVAAFDTVADPEDTGGQFGTDIDAFVNFMRSLKVPPRDTRFDVTAGQNLFSSIGCAECHIPTIQTAPPGTSINGGTFTVPAALGDKIIHPYSDFLLHDIGTGDGIVQGSTATRNRMRTPPLWGLRVRPRLMHDLASFTRNEAIARHGGQAAAARNNFNALTLAQKNDLIAFLNSL